MRIYLSLLTLVFLSLVSIIPLAAEESNETNCKKAWISIEKTEIDLGEIAANSVFSGKIPIHNVSNDPIKLNNIKRTCGCTNSSFDSEILQKNGLAFVNYAIDTSKVGSGKKSVFLYLDIEQNGVPLKAPPIRLSYSVPNLRAFNTIPSAIVVSRYDNINNAVVRLLFIIGVSVEDLKISSSSNNISIKKLTEMSQDRGVVAIIVIEHLNDFVSSNIHINTLKGSLDVPVLVSNLENIAHQSPTRE
jgi:hypothetical protein